MPGIILPLPLVEPDRCGDEPGDHQELRHSHDGNKGEGIGHEPGKEGVCLRETGEEEDPV